MQELKSYPIVLRLFSFKVNYIFINFLAKREQSKLEKKRDKWQIGEAINQVVLIFSQFKSVTATKTKPFSQSVVKISAHSTILFVNMWLATFLNPLLLSPIQW
jgi:hypothetical protein